MKNGGSNIRDNMESYNSLNLGYLLYLQIVVSIRCVIAIENVVSALYIVNSMLFSNNFIENYLTIRLLIFYRIIELQIL